MSASRVVYHEGAASDVRSALAWYEKRSAKAALDFIEELNRAAEAIRKAPERCRWEATTLGDFCCGDFHLPSSIHNRKG
jgi:plasmid stabilization system protein ParE